MWQIMGHLCGQELTDTSVHVLKNKPDHFLQSDLLFPGEGMRGEGSLCCDTICSVSEYCREHRSNSLKKQKDASSMGGSKACAFPGCLFHTVAPEAPVTETMTRNTAVDSKTRTTVMILQFWEIMISSNLKHIF